MYIRKVVKKNKNSNKEYVYFRLVHGYKIGNKVRQQVLLNLGKLDKELPISFHKALADRIEMLLTGSTPSFFNKNAQVEKLAKRFVKEILKEKIFPRENSIKPISTPQEKQYEVIDMSSIQSNESRDIGGEWLCKQAFDALGINSIFTEMGMDKTEVNVAKMLLTAKLIHPSSELETERWLKENSATVELYDETIQTASRYRLYKASEKLYENKERIEKEIYSTCSTMFEKRNKIVIYDLTNFYFEGQKRESNKAHFGRSKEKRNDCRLISLSMAIDCNGFVRHSEIYEGNVGESATLIDLLAKLEGLYDNLLEKPVVIMDAGISSNDNLQLIKKEGYDYVSVSRLQTKKYNKLSKGFTTIHDNRGNKIEIDKVSIEDQSDCFLHIKSDEKIKKEESMDKKATDRFEKLLTDLKNGLSKPRTIKKRVKVQEKIGTLKSRYSKVAQLYTITYIEDKDLDIITDITWKRNKEKEKPKGEYFLRYSKNDLTDKEVWDIYNLTREVESTFRCLKSDLNIRPLHHRFDKHIESHIWLGILAYQVVNYIRQKLHKQGIDHSWKKIVEKMRSQQRSIIQMDTKEGKRMYIKLCSAPIEDVQSIYKALNFKNRPYTRITKVVTQNQK